MSKNKIYQKIGEKIKDKTFAHFSSLWDKFGGTKFSLQNEGRHFLILRCPRFLRHDTSFWGTTIIYWKGSQDGTSIWPKRFYPFTAIIFKSGGTRLCRALFSPISLSANLPRFKPNLTGQSNNPPFTDSCLRFEISCHVWVTFLVGYPTRTLTVTCSHVFGDLRSSECGPPITTHSSVSIY